MRGRVLVVEDEWVTRTLVAECLSDHGFAVREAETGEEAVRIIHDGGPFDLLITDLNLGTGISGREVAACFRTCAPDTPIVFASAYPAVATDTGGPLAIRAFLRKPYGQTEIMRVVDSIVSVIELSAA